MSAKRSEFEDKGTVASGSAKANRANAMHGKSSKILVKKPQPADLSKPISSKNVKYCVICLSSPSAFDMSQKRVSGLRFKIYKKLHASFGFPSAKSKEFHFCCKGCFESVNHLHKLQEKPQEIEIEVKEVAVRIRTAVRTRIPVNLELAKSTAFEDCRSETVEEESDDDNSLMKQQTAHCTSSSDSDVSLSHPQLDPRLDSVDWNGCVICRSQPSTTDMRNKRLAKRRFEVYKKLDTSYQLPTAESTEKEFHYCCEKCFKAVDHLHNMQVKLGKVQSEIQAIVARINTSFLSRNPATLELGKSKDCGSERVERRNRSERAAARRKNENFMIGDDDCIEVEIKDEVKEEMFKQEVDYDDDDFMEQQEDVGQRRARGSSVLDQEAGSRNLSKSAAARKANRKSDAKRGIGEKLIKKKIIPAWKSLLPSHEKKQKMMKIYRDRQLNEKQNQEKIYESAPSAKVNKNTSIINGKSAKKQVCQQLNEASAAGILIRNNTQKKVKCKRQLHCYFCSMKFFYQNQLLLHISQHTLEQPLPYKCTICEARFNHISSRNFHIARVHESAKPLKCTIKDCIYRTDRKTDLIRHKRTHTKYKPFKCDICKVSFTQRSNRILHVNRIHKKLKPHKCTRKGCSSRFFYPSELRHHINKDHKNVQPYKCTVNGCNRRFYRSQDLRFHLNVHKGLELFACTFDSCDFQTVYNRSFIAHMQKHGPDAEKRFGCGKCQKRFAVKSSLLRHQNNCARCPA